MLKQEYFRRFPEDCVVEGCAEVEGGKDGRKGRRKQGEEVDWYRCVRHSAGVHLSCFRSMLTDCI